MLFVGYNCAMLLGGCRIWYSNNNYDNNKQNADTANTNASTTPHVTVHYH